MRTQTKAPKHNVSSAVAFALSGDQRGTGAVIDALVAAAASVNIRDDPKTSVDSTFGYTPLHAAAFHGNQSTAAALLKHGANLAVREQKYRGTPAGWATTQVIRKCAISSFAEAVAHNLTERAGTISRAH